MLNLTKPRYVFPSTATPQAPCTPSSPSRSGMSDEDIFNGRERCRSRSTPKATIVGKEHAGMIFVDGVEIGDPRSRAARPPQLSADGIFIVVATVDGQTGDSVAPPELIAGSCSWPTTTCVSRTSST